MSFFKCSHCGVGENTALTHGFIVPRCLEESAKEAAASYRKVLGLAEGEPFGVYCSQCNPVWYTNKGTEYGIGPNPNPTVGYGLWHGKFPRRPYEDWISEQPEAPKPPPQIDLLDELEDLRKRSTATVDAKARKKV